MTLDGDFNGQGHAARLAANVRDPLWLRCPSHVVDGQYVNALSLYD